MNYGIIKNLVSDDLRTQMIDLMDLLKDVPSFLFLDNDFTSSKVFQYHNIFNSFQLHILPEVERAFGKELVPTYNFSRIYYKGSFLKKHSDRPACECSITINLYQEGGTWPIWMEDDNGASKLNLNPGDAAWYKGCEVEHWREENRKGICYQTFMHYVDKNGKRKNQIYDKKIDLWNKGLNNPIYKLDF
jgi:hypothetical protein